MGPPIGAVRSQVVDSIARFRKARDTEIAITFRHLVKTANGDTEIANRGVRVYTILGLRESGDAPEDIADAYRLPLGAVYEALAYAANYPEEMRSIREEEEAIEYQTLLGIPEQLRHGLDIP